MQTHEPQPQGQDGVLQPTSIQPQPETPLLLGRYRVVETRGTGGFGAVQVCWDVRLQRRVAIKCLPLAAAPGTSTSTLQEALDEARITSRLSHPNIVTVHDFEVTADAAYLIMEYVDGLTLAELMARVEDGVLTYDECAHLLSCLSKALTYAHDNGVLHLDIKPSNVFINTSAEVKIGDFGMASLTSAAGWGGARGGTVGYMPPEQLEGGLVDERTDVFALAVVCYQALTGTCPFAGKDTTASLGRITRGARPLSKVEAELAGPVSDGIAQALSADPAARPSTVSAFADTVLPFLGDEQVGRDSIASLMAQTTGENGPDEGAWEQAARVRAIERWPWLPQAAQRCVCALACGMVGWRLGPIAAVAVAPGSLATNPIVCLVVIGAIGAALPATGGALVACALIVAAMLASGVHSPAFLVALVVGVLVVLWQLGAGLRSRLSGAALLMPAALGTATAGAGLAGAALPPVAAGITAALGVALQVVVGLVTPGSNGDTLAQACALAFAQPTTWMMLTAAAGAAWVASLVGYGRGPVAGTMAQVIAAATLICVRIAAPGMENAGLWLGAEAPSVAVAVLCALLVSVAVCMFGPAPRPQEDE